MTDHAAREWWPVVNAIAAIIALDEQSGDVLGGTLRIELIRLGYAASQVDEALQWLEDASLSGSLVEILQMLQPHSECPRIASPLEQICLSDFMWQRIETIRFRGLIGQDLNEKLLEGIRSLDTRDWDDDEVWELVTDVVSCGLPGMTDDKLKRLLWDRDPELYS